MGLFMKSRALLCLALLFLPIALGGCRSSEAAPRRKKTGKSHSAARRSVRRQGPILARGYVFRLDRSRERGEYQLIFDVAEVIRGNLVERKPVIQILQPALSLPWIKDREYEGAEAYLHLEEKRGSVLVLGFSQSAKSDYVPLN